MVATVGAEWVVPGRRRALVHLGTDLYLNSPEYYAPFDSRDDKRCIIAPRLPATSGRPLPC